MTQRYSYMPMVNLDLSDVVDPAVRYAATEAYYAASARCANTCLRYRRNAIEYAARMIHLEEGFGACLTPGALRVRDEI